MISIESADTSKRGASLSSSNVIPANGDAEDADGDVEAVEEVLAFLLWKEPYWKPLEGNRCTRPSLRHVKVRLAIMEMSSRYESAHLHGGEVA